MAEVSSDILVEERPPEPATNPPKNERNQEALNQAAGYAPRRYALKTGPVSRKIRFDGAELPKLFLAGLAGIAVGVFLASSR